MIESTGPASLPSAGRAVSRQMRNALLVAITLVGLGFVGGDWLPLADRAIRVAASAAIMLAWLAVAIGSVARARFRSADDIEGALATGRPDDRVRIGVAILQNTLEQVVLAIPTQLLIAYVFDRSGLLIVLLAACFSIGRTLFWTGYARGAPARAFGFGLTFYPTVLVLALSIGMLVARLL